MVIVGDGDIPVDPEFVRRLAESANKAVAPGLEAMQRAIEESIAPMLEKQRQALELSVAPFVQAQAEAINSWVGSNQDFLRPLLEAAEKMREAWEHAIRPNLRDLDAEDFFRAIEMSTEHGPCVMWAPRTEIVRELIAADTFSARSEILEHRRHEILSDVTAALADSTYEALGAQADARELTTLAIAAAGDGHDAAAQALTAAALGCVLEQVLGYPRLGAAFRDMRKHDIEETHFGILRLVALELATSKSLVNTDEHVAGFNRHGTQHGDRSFYGSGEMLSGLLLVGTWVRELSWWAASEPSFLINES